MKNFFLFCIFLAVDFFLISSVAFSLRELELGTDNKILYQAISFVLCPLGFILIGYLYSRIKTFNNLTNFFACVKRSWIFFLPFLLEILIISSETLSKIENGRPIDFASFWHDLVEIFILFGAGYILAFIGVFIDLKTRN